MKKNKVIRLTENDLVNIIKRVLLENPTPGGPTLPGPPEPETRQPADIRQELEKIKGAEIIMSNASGVNIYKGTKQIFKSQETYKILDVWFPEYKGVFTVAFTVSPANSGTVSPANSGTEIPPNDIPVQGKEGLFKGTFTRQKNDTSKAIQFRWDCVSYFEKGLGAKNEQLQRYGGFKENFINTELAREILRRPFCGKAPGKEKLPEITQKSFRGNPLN